MQHLQPNTTLQGGKYRIERVLGQGGFGITYLARNTVFDVNVAIKEFFMKDENGREGNSVTMPNTTKTELFNGQKEKFKKEAKRMFAIKNEHIVSVHDLFEENSTAYYVMEYVDGENLAEYLKRTGQPMSEEKVKKILPQILDALKSVHDAGIWHLDMKPANILMDKSGNVKLIDFGASKQLNTKKGGATTSTAISYTNGFAPREQMEQNYDKFGPWTDIYALGATLYNLLTNKRPQLPSDIDDDISEDKHLALPMSFVSDNMRKLILWLMKTNRMERPQNILAIIEQQNLFIAKNCLKESKSKDHNNEKISDDTLLNVKDQGQKTQDLQNEVTFRKRRSMIVTKILLIINTLMFLAYLVFQRTGFDLNNVLGIHFFLAPDFHLYQLFTYMFMHANFIHLFFNMFALWMFGCVVENVWGPKKFLFYYISCGVGAGIIQEVAQFGSFYYLASTQIDDFNFVDLWEVAANSADYLNLWITVGTSGVIFAIILAFVILFPKEKIWVIKIKWLIPFLIFITILSALTESIDNFSIGQLGGMIIGYLIIFYWKRKRHLIFNSDKSIWTAKEFTFQIHDSNFQKIKLRALKMVLFYIIFFILLFGGGILSFLSGDPKIENKQNITEEIDSITEYCADTLEAI